MVWRRRQKKVWNYVGNVQRFLSASFAYERQKILIYHYANLEEMFKCWSSQEDCRY